MTSRDLAALAYKAMAAWLFVTGVIAVISALLTWAPNVAMYGQETTSWHLATAAVYIPVGALAWLASDSASVAFAESCPDRSRKVTSSMATKHPERE